MITMTFNFGCLFDLDGVIVDTARYHFMAWRRIADELGFVFTEQDNERLKGVSRMQSLDILLSIGKVNLDPAAKQALAARKNALYVEYIAELGPDAMLPGAREFLIACRAHGIATALASASRNAPAILARLQIANLFDSVVDGTVVAKAKPAPDVFLVAAERIGVAPEHCVVFEDAEAGITAAKAAGMHAVGIGSPAVLTGVGMVVPGLFAVTLDNVIAALFAYQRCA